MPVCEEDGRRTINQAGGVGMTIHIPLIGWVSLEALIVGILGVFLVLGFILIMLGEG